MSAPYAFRPYWASSVERRLRVLRGFELGTSGVENLALTATPHLWSLTGWLISVLS
jgi:hypothetical protein